MIDDIETFRAHLDAAEVVDDDYDLAGSSVWKPFGVKLRRRFLDLVESEVESAGYAKHDFPLLIPRSYMGPQKEHITSFEDAVCWVTRFGDTDLSDPPYLRPTGETQIYPMLADWIRSYRDLPRKLYQTGEIHRPVTEGTPLLKAQGSKMTEGHGFFADEAAARDGQDAAVTLIDRIHRRLGIDGLVVERPLWGNKPVATRNLSIDIPLPTGKTRMSAGTYLQNTLYSEAYDIHYDASDGSKQPVRQITWGLSTSLLGIYLLLSGDDKGFRLLPELAPVQAVFVPIQNSEAEIERCKSLAGALNLRTTVDTSTDALGQKLETWERRGVPLRIEVGPDELNDGTVTVYRRDRQTRQTVDSDAADIKAVVDDVGETIRDDLASFVRSRIDEVTSLDDLDTTLSAGRVSSFPFCGERACGEAIEADRVGELLGTALSDDDPAACLGCGDDTESRAFYSRRM